MEKKLNRKWINRIEEGSIKLSGQKEPEEQWENLELQIIQVQGLQKTEC